MPLETGNYISDLNASNPLAGDPKSQGDDHLRLIKAVLKATFPNISGAVTPTQAELSQLAGTTITAYAKTLLAALDAATTRGLLGGTTAGQAVFTVANPSAISFLRINADNSATLLSAADFRTALSLGSMALQASTTVNISGGSIGGVSVAATTLSCTGNAALGDAEATDTHAIKGATTLLANSASAALTVTQTGAGNAFVVEDSTSPDSTPFVIDASGNVAIGSTTASEKLNLVSDSRLFLQLTRASSDSAQPVVSFRKARGTNASPTVVANGDVVGDLQFYGYDGANYITATQIKAEVDGTPGTNDMPGRLVFSTTADGAAIPTERMRIDSAGQVGVGTTPSQQLHVYEAAGNSFTGVRVQNSNSGTGSAGIEFSVDTTYAKAAIAQVRSALNGGGALVFYVDSNTDAADWGSGDEKMRIDSAGNVGIGGLVDISGASAGQIKFPATQNPSADANTLDDYREASATLTATGMTTSPTGTAYLVRAGNKVTMEVPYITGTSNATTFTLTGIPTAFRPTGGNRDFLIHVVDNGSVFGLGMGRIDTSGVITLFKDPNGSAFTNTGTKSVGAINISYVIA